MGRMRLSGSVALVALTVLGGSRRLPLAVGGQTASDVDLGARESTVGVASYVSGVLSGTDLLASSHFVVSSRRTRSLFPHFEERNTTLR